MWIVQLFKIGKFEFLYVLVVEHNCFTKKTATKVYNVKKKEVVIVFFTFNNYFWALQAYTVL